VTFAASGIGGLLIRLRRGHRPIFLDLGARYIANGEAEYLREGSITIVNDQVIFQPIRSATNLVVYHVGVSFGIGNCRRSGGRPRHTPRVAVAVPPASPRPDTHHPRPPPGRPRAVSNA
jgi:hypothetical protein